MWSCQCPPCSLLSARRAAHVGSGCCGWAHLWGPHAPSGSCQRALASPGLTASALPVGRVVLAVCVCCVLLRCVLLGSFCPFVFTECPFITGGGPCLQPSRDQHISRLPLTIIFFNLLVLGCAESSLLRLGFPLRRAGLLSLETIGFRASVVAARGPTCPSARGLFPDPGLSPCPLHWQADSSPLDLQGSPPVMFNLSLPFCLKWVSYRFLLGNWSFR